MFDSQNIMVSKDSYSQFQLFLRLHAYISYFFLLYLYLDLLQHLYIFIEF